MPPLPINLRRVVIAAGILILVMMVIDFNRRLENLLLLDRQRDAMRVEATHMIETQLAIQTQVGFAGSSQAVEEWARTDGHYLQDGDHPVVPIGPPGNEPVETSTPTAVPTPVPNWQVWWTLFFGQ